MSNICLTKKFSEMYSSSLYNNGDSGGKPWDNNVVNSETKKNVEKSI